MKFHDNGNGTATLSGTPVTADIGSHTIAMTAANTFASATHTATQSFTLTVTAAPAVVSTSVGLFPPLFAGITPNGRTILAGVGNNPPIIYLIDSTSAFIVGTGGSGESGFVEQQTTGLSTASFSGQFFFGSEAPTTGSQYQSGTATFDGAGGVTGNSDRSGPDGLGVDSFSPTMNGGTDSFSSTSTPTGKGTVGTNSIAYAVSSSKIIFMSTSSDVDISEVQK